MFTGEPRRAGTFLPLRLTEDTRLRHLNLLYAQSTQSTMNVSHFVLIKDLSRLVGVQLSRSRRKKYICNRYVLRVYSIAKRIVMVFYNCRCLHYFTTNEKLQFHSIDCGRMNDCAVVLLKDNSDKWLYFRNLNHQERLPFVVYDGLECILEKRNNDDASMKDACQ